MTFWPLLLVSLVPASAQPEPSRAEVAAAVETIEGFDNFLVLKDSYDPREVGLGRDLFFDPRLSGGGTMSCASCHLPERAYSDGRPRSRGHGGLPLLRNAPALKNTGLDPHYQVGLFRDGRAASVEDVVKAVMQAPLEFGTTPAAVAAKLSSDEKYRGRFRELYGAEGATAATAAKALAAFVNSLTPTRLSPYDRVLDDWNALDAAQKRGLVLFAGKARCVECHYSPDLAGSEIVNTGLRPAPGIDDEGRYRVTGAPRDRGAFKIPSLRNAAVTAPYMHDGSLATLADVVEFYDRGGDDHANQDRRVRPLSLTEREKKDLVAFLLSLTNPPEPGDPPYVDTAASEVPGASTAPAAARSPYWDEAAEIADRLTRAQERLETLGAMRRAWTARADYSGPACSESAAPDRLVEDERAGVFDAGERAFLRAAVFWDLSRYYWARAMAERDGSLCARLAHQGSKFSGDSGYYQCRNWYLELGFIEIMATRPPDFMKRCEDITSVDNDALRYKPLCPTIRANLGDIDAMCGKLYAPFLQVTSLRSCKTLFSALNGAPLDCAHYFRSPTGYDRCETYGAYLRAVRAGDARVCGGSESCEVLMGGGRDVAARAAARIRAKLCAADPGRAAFVEREAREIDALLGRAQALLEKAAPSPADGMPAPAEAAEGLSQVASLRRRLADYRLAAAQSASSPAKENGRQ
jgi:cytochrome c peroxidase